MAKVTNVSVGFGVDVRDFHKFAQALAVAAPEVKHELTNRLRAVGDMVADEAKSNVAPYSQSIPPSIKVRVSGETVSVIAKGNLAGLFELGNRKSSSTTSFSHPVFGNKAVWVKQPMHPFLAPAVRSKETEVELGAIEALETAIETAVKL